MSKPPTRRVIHRAPARAGLATAPPHSCPARRHFPDTVGQGPAVARPADVLQTGCADGANVGAEADAVAVARDALEAAGWEIAGCGTVGVIDFGDACRCGGPRACGRRDRIRRFWRRTRGRLLQSSIRIASGVRNCRGPRRRRQRERVVARIEAVRREAPIRARVRQGVVSAREAHESDGGQRFRVGVAGSDKWTPGLPRRRCRPRWLPGK